MLRMSTLLSCLAVLAFAASFSGCGGAGDSDQPPPAADQTEASSGEEHAGHEHGEGEHAEHMHGDTEGPEGFAELSPEDRAAAEKQRICPVSGEALGSMGKPFKVTHQGRDVFLCCEMCKDSFNEDPEKYLAKLNQ